MTDSKIKLCATDKEVFDVLMSGKRRFAEPTLLALARDRGVFYSAGESREKLASNLSLLPFGYNELAALLQNAQGARAEKVTHVTLGIELSIDQIKSVVSQYTSQAPSDERVVHHQSGEKNVTVDVQYSEIDYSKTRLVQRREREAEIEFIVEDGQTTIRMPANEKAKEITASF